MNRRDQPNRDDTVEAILLKSRRETIPMRTAFVQIRVRQRPHPGPLAAFVRAHDHRGLLLYLLFLAAASTPPWDVALPSTVWGRAIGLQGSTGVSKAWRRLADRRLIERGRKGRQASIVALKEDGSGAPYSHPGRVRESYFQIPFAFWTAPERWYRTLNLSETAILLIALSLGDGFILPVEKMQAWYGISADTAASGLDGLRRKNLLYMEKQIKSAPLSAIGYTEERRYTLLDPFGPKGYQSVGARSEERQNVSAEEFGS